MGKLRCCSAALLALIAFAIAAGFETGTARAADLPSSSADQPQQPSLSTGSDPAQNATTPDQVATAVTDQATTALGRAAQDATDIANDVANSASGIDGPAAAIASSASTAAADIVSSATQAIAPTQGTGGTPAGSTPDSPGGVPPTTSTATGSSPDRSPTAVQGAPTAQLTAAAAAAAAADAATLTAAAAAAVAAAATLTAVPDAAPSGPVGEPSRPTKPTTGADRATTRPVHTQSGASAVESARTPATERPAIQVGGLVGGTQSAAPGQIPAPSGADTTAKQKGGTPKRVNPLAALAHGARIVTKILPHELPSASLGGGLAGDGPLMMRIAKLLALVYAGFLIIWFWATRVRWNGR